MSNTWSAVSQINGPLSESLSAVWTGQEMVVWGGYRSGLSRYSDSGARYNPSTNTWAQISTVNAPTARWHHSAVWTGNQMIIWGGSNGVELRSGSRYTP